MGEIRYGPSGLPSRESPEEAVAILVERGYTACEVDFASGFWMKDEYAWATRLGELARDVGIALSIHAPIAAFKGHVERDQKHVVDIKDLLERLLAQFGNDAVEKQMGGGIAALAQGRLQRLDLT